MFFMNRYLTLLGHVPVMFKYFWRIGDKALREKVSCRFLFELYGTQKIVRIFFSGERCTLMFLYDVIDSRVGLKRCGQMQVYHQFFVVAVQSIAASMFSHFACDPSLYDSVLVQF
jgi:hypothetical protein